MNDLIERAKEVGFHRAAMEAGATITGGPLENFERGWGKHPFKGASIAHYWTAHRDPRIEEEMVKQFGEAARGIYGIDSACGLTTSVSKRIPLLGQGNLPYCKRCENKLMKEPPNE